MNERGEVEIKSKKGTSVLSEDNLDCVKVKGYLRHQDVVVMRRKAFRQGIDQISDTYLITVSDSSTFEV
ncbi:hypothetical protein ACTXT7_000663 [Hymenolepis weldensis]